MNFPYLCSNTLLLAIMLKRFPLIIGCLAFALTACQPQDKYIAISGYAQGGTYTVKLNLNGSHGRIHTSPMQIKASIDSIFQMIDTTLSGYNKGSMISRFNRGETIVPNTMFKDIYSEAYRFWKESDGLLDVASGKLFDLWGFGFTKDSLPSDQMILETLKVIGMKRLQQEIVPDLQGRFSAENLIVQGQKTSAELPILNYNAIAQGYSCDQIATYLYSLGVKDMLVEVGEIFCDGVNPNGQGWSIGVDRPEDGNNQPGKDIQAIWQSDGKPHGVVTSGNYRKFYIKDGQKYSHTIDPKTGYPVNHNLLSATIIADDSMTADAYATYCMVLGLEKAQEFIESQEGIEGYLVYGDGEEMKEWASSGFLLKEMN